MNPPVSDPSSTEDATNDDAMAPAAGSGDLVFLGPTLADGTVAPRRVAVSEGRIVSVDLWDGVRAAETADVVELSADEVLLPGLVDTHVHINEPGRTEWEGFATATRAAAAGGVTTVLDMPLNSIPATVSVDALETKRAVAAGQCTVDVGFWGGAVPDSLGTLAELAAAGVFGFKCFLLDSGVPEFPPLDADQLHAAMTEIAAFDGLLIVHAEDPTVIAEHAVAHTSSYDEFLGSRPPAAENRAIDTVIATARATGCRTHIVHLSSAEALPDLRQARADGVRITVETCPHYLTLQADQILDGQTQYKCCPPVRDAANSDQLWAALAEGVIDFVVTDHSPSSPDLKHFDTGDFGTAWGGIASLQLGLSLVWTAARERGHDLVTVGGWMAERPAAVVGVAGKGRIAVGHQADLAVFAPDESWTVDAAALQHRHPVTPYDGRRLTGLVRSTYLRGERLILGGDPHGTLITSTSRK